MTSAASRRPQLSGNKLKRYIKNSIIVFLMMRIKFLTQLVFCALLCLGATAQEKDTSRFAVAVFAPLYIDSVFEGSVYKHPSENLPRYLMAGLDFYNGVILAADELKKDGISDLDIHIYDTKKNGGLEHSIEYLPSNYFSLIIASFTNTEEQKMLSEYALKYNIPLVSATYPNESGIENNPLFLLCNPSLKTHVKAIADHCNEALNNKTNVYFITRKGNTEALIEQWFDESISEKKKIKKLSVNEENLSTLSFSFVDTSKQSLFVVGSLNEAFSVQLAKHLDTLNLPNITLLGMPTWEGVRDLQHKRIRNVKLMHTNAFSTDRKSSKYSTLAKKYYADFMATPSEMVLKGYEVTYRFCRLLKAFKSDFINHVSDDNYDVWNSYKFVPIKTSDGVLPDLLENQNVKFVIK